MDVRFLINGRQLDFDGGEALDGGTYLPVTDTCFHGSVRRTRLTRGLYCYIFDFLIDEPCLFLKEFSNADGDQVYAVHYHPYPEYEQVEYATDGKQGTCRPKESTVFILTCPGSTRSVYTQAAQLRRIMLVFSRQWLLRQLRDLKNTAPPAAYLVELMRATKERTMSKGEFALVQMLFDVFKGQAYSLEVKAYVYYLVTFLYRRARVSARRDGASSYRTLMMKVEKRILSSLFGTMPSLDELAKESLISVSTLKRQFKDTFGMPLYDYYLHKKMELAKDLLQRGQLSVSEVAFQLGYEGVSHFTTIFKKMFGYPPGKIKQEVKRLGEGEDTEDSINK